MSDSPTIDIGENIRLLGTAHVASASVAAVKEQVELFKPDVIAVELCESRYSALLSDRRLDREGLLKVIKEGKALTPDMDGKSSTAELGAAILDKL